MIVFNDLIFLSRYNCLFEMISQQIGCDVSKIKQSTAQIMEDNKPKLAVDLHALKFLRRNNRDKLFFDEKYLSST